MIDDQHYENKKQARSQYSKALYQGKLKRPSKCFLCKCEPGKAKNGRAKIHGHHPDYNNGLKVVWLCEKCHRRIHIETFHIWRLQESNQFRPVHLVEFLYRWFPRLDGQKAIKVIKTLFPNYNASLNALSTWKARLRAKGVYIPDKRKKIGPA